MKSLKLAIPTALCAVGLAHADNYSYGVGAFQCGTWTANRNRELIDSAGWIPVSDQASWLLGWISAAGLYSDYTIPKTDYHAAVEWMNNYCQKHPLDHVDVAAAKLIEELKR